jgi:hypothetical protein
MIPLQKTACLTSYRHFITSLRKELCGISCIWKNATKSLSQICKLELFRKIEFKWYDFEGESGEGTELTERTAKDLSGAMKKNTKLETLSIQCTAISPLVSSVLCEGLTTENQNLTELLFRNVEFGAASSDQPSAPADAVSHLATGLQNNKTLKRLSVNRCSFVPNRGGSWFIKALEEALEGHPTLEHLNLKVFSVYPTSESLYPRPKNTYRPF